MAGIVKIAFASTQVAGQPQYMFLIVDQLNTRTVSLGSIDDVRRFTTYLQQDNILKYYSDMRQAIADSSISDGSKQMALEGVEGEQTQVINALKTSSRFDIGSVTVIDAGEGSILDASDSLVVPVSDETLAAAIARLAEAG